MFENRTLFFGFTGSTFAAGLLLNFETMKSCNFPAIRHDATMLAVLVVAVLTNKALSGLISFFWLMKVYNGHSKKGTSRFTNNSVVALMVNMHPWYAAISCVARLVIVVIFASDLELIANTKINAVYFSSFFITIPKGMFN